MWPFKRKENLCEFRDKALFRDVHELRQSIKDMNIEISIMKKEIEGFNENKYYMYIQNQRLEKQIARLRYKIYCLTGGECVR
jgi:regulator of replication initiation timing